MCEALTPVRAASPGLDAIFGAALFLGIAAVRSADVCVAPDIVRHAKADEVVGLARGPVAVGAEGSGGSARPDKVITAAPRLSLQIVLPKTTTISAQSVLKLASHKRCGCGCSHQSDPSRVRPGSVEEVLHLPLLCRARHRRQMPARMVSSAVILSVVPCGWSRVECEDLSAVGFVGCWRRAGRRRRHHGRIPCPHGCRCVDGSGGKWSWGVPAAAQAAFPQTYAFVPPQLESAQLSPPPHASVQSSPAPTSWSHWAAPLLHELGSPAAQLS